MELSQQKDTIPFRVPRTTGSTIHVIKPAKPNLNTTVNHLKKFKLAQAALHESKI